MDPSIPIKPLLRGLLAALLVALPTGLLERGEVVAAPQDETNVCALVGTNGVIPAGTVWTAEGSPYLVPDCDLVVSDEESSLTIEAGVEVRFGERRGMSIGGPFTAAPGVVMTSIQTNKTPGDWEGLEIAQLPEGVSIQLDGLVLRYAGSNASGGALFIRQAGLSIADLKVENSGGRGIYIDRVGGTSFSGLEITGSRAAGLAVREATGNQIGLTLENARFRDNAEAAVSVTPNVQVVSTGTSASGNGINGLLIDGTRMDTDVTWQGGDLPVVIDSSLIIDGALTLQPGTVVKFRGEQRALRVTRGSIEAVGTTESPIYFTSITDDEACIASGVDCDTNNDGDRSAPSPGEWQRIEISRTAGESHIEQAMIRYGGGPAMLDVRASGFTIRDSTVAFGEGDGMVVEEVDLTVEGIHFADLDGVGIRIAAGSGVDIRLHDNRFERIEGAVVFVEPNTQLDLSGNAVSGDGLDDYSNGLNGIAVDGGDITRPIAWSAGDLPFVIGNGERVAVDTGGSLTIAPGAVLKMGTESELNVERGQLAVGSLDGAKTLITALTDDSCDAEDSAGGCDTNGDTSFTTPQRGVWGRIAVRQESSSAIRNCIIRYGGAKGVSSMLLLEHDKDRVEACEIGHSEGNGVEAAKANAFYFVGNRIHDNGGNGLQLGMVANGMTVYLEGNTFVGNTGAAVAMDANARLELDDPDDPAPGVPNTIEDNGINGAAVQGNATISRVWKAGNLSYVLLGDVDVRQQSVLTIEAGTVVKLRDAKLTASRGAIVAEGTADRPVIFTSVNDDSVGVEALPLEGAVDPLAGDWAGLDLGCLSRAACSRLEHVEVRYAGGEGSPRPAVQIADDDVVVASTLIRDGAGSGVLIDSVDATIEDSTIRGMFSDAIVIEASEPIRPTLRNNRIEGNQGAVIRMDANAEVELEGTEFENNEINGIAVSGTASVRRLWQASDMPYVLVDGGVSIGANAAIEVEAGTIIKADLGTSLSVERGAVLNIPLRSSGDAPVILTSLRDDGVCTAEGLDASDPRCDTNNGKNQLRPRPGDWDGIAYARGANGMRLAGIQLYYAGGSGAAIEILAENAEVIDSVVAYSDGNGIEVSGVPVRLIGNTIRDCTENGLLLSGRWSGGTGSVIEGNGFTRNGRSIDFDGDGEASFSSNVAVGNDEDAMLFCSKVSSNQVWSNDLVREIDCVLDVDASLEIEPGTVLQFEESGGLDVNSRLVAEGVVFTGSGQEMLPGFWSQLSFAPTSLGGSLRHNLFLFGGESNSGVVDVQTGKSVEVLYNLFLRTFGTAVSTDTGPKSSQNPGTVVSGNIITEILGNTSAGLRVADESEPVFERNRLTTMVRGVTSRRGSAPVIRFNSFSRIAELGVNNEDPEVCIDATNNWWGDATGPLDESDARDERCAAVSENRNARGVRVSNHVDYSRWIQDAEPPISPQLDTLFCGVTNDGLVELQGSTTPNARVSFFDLDAGQPILTVDADEGGRFSADLSLGDGEHSISVEASAERMAGGETIELRSPRSSYRHIVVDSSSKANPSGIRFVYGPANAQRLQPLRDVTGCATACGAPSSGRVTLPTNTDVQVRIPISGNPSSVVFRQLGQPDQELSNRRDYWESEPFRPVPGPFTIAIDEVETDSCFGFVYLGNAGRVFTDSGIPAEPGRYEIFDFEDQDRSDWVSDAASWKLTDALAHSGRFSLTDSPDGNYGPDRNDSVSSLRTYDLQEIPSPQLKFWHRYRFASGDSGFVEVTTDGRNWRTLATFEETRDTWVAETVSLEAVAEERDVRVRFRISTDRSPITVDDGWYVDDITIVPGGADNDRYDEGEPLVEDAQVTLRQRNVDTGAWRDWEGGPTGQINPQTTDRSGTYGFYNLPPGEYRVEVSSRELGVVVSDIIPVWDGTLSIDIPLTGREPVYFPITYNRSR